MFIKIKGTVCDCLSGSLLTRSSLRLITLSSASGKEGWGVFSFFTLFMACHRRVGEQSESGVS